MRLLAFIFLIYEAGSLNCDFEENLCSFQNVGSAVWERETGPTATADTGPERDHTTNTSLGSYVYVESSYPNYPDVEFIIQSDMTVTGSTNPCT